jgi:HK97 gp10 family phage protein
MARRSGVFGASEAAAALRELAKLVGAPANEASRFALRPIVQEAKANLDKNKSVISGRLKKSLTVKRDSRSPKLKPRHLVGPRRDSDAVRIAHLVEFGTAPHDEPKAGIHHPGARPKPFLRPAYESRKDEAVQRFGQRFGPAVERQAAKLARKRQNG